MQLLYSRMVVSAWLLCAGLAWAGFQSAAWAAGPTPSVPPATQTASRERIAKLIKQLGDDDYFVRERAQEELSQIGTEAFDSLSEAEFDDDAEISARSQYLVRLMKIHWVQPTDSAEVKDLLSDYDTSNEKVRTDRINQLTALPDDKGLAALCRLVRFEKSQTLSKYAALKVIGQKKPDEAKWPAREQAIVAGVGQSPRTGAEWLRVYLEVNRDPNADLEAWGKLAELETSVLKQFPNQSRPDLAMTLWKEQVTLMRKLGRNEEALAAVRKVAALESGAPETLTDLIDWLVKQQAWAVIDETALRFTERFEQEPLLLYTLAQARQAQGNTAATQEAVDRAMKLNEGNQFQHMVVADKLQKRGLLKWSEAEFRLAIKLGQTGQGNTLRAEYLLAELLLHDAGRDLEAAEVLDPAVKFMQEQAKAGAPINNAFLELETVISRRDFFYACHFASINNRDKQVEYLKSALEANKLDADVLIALYRVPDLEAGLRDKTRKAIRDAAEDFRRQIQGAQDDAMPYNQLAWLIANTEGDAREALRCSQESLRIKPEEPGYLDTLGRCHYFAGDLENAVKSQSRAVELQPWSGLMSKQLEFFKAELAKKKAA